MNNNEPPLFFWGGGVVPFASTFPLQPCTITHIFDYGVHLLPYKGRWIIPFYRVPNHTPYAIRHMPYAIDHRPDTIRTRLMKEVDGSSERNRESWWFFQFHVSHQDSNLNTLPEF